MTRNPSKQNLTSANLRGADLTSADLTSANLSAADRFRSMYNTRTKSPANLDPDSADMEEVEDEA